MTFALDAETARGLVIRCRKDWDPREADGAVAQARVAGWDDRRIFRALTLALMDDEATPADLRKAVERDRPLAVRGGLAPEQNAARAAEARAAAGIPPQLHEAGEPA